MLIKFHSSGFVKEILFTALTLSAYICVGICRGYAAFLFHHLDMPDSTIVINNEQKSWLASSASLLGPIGSVFSGTLMDFCGRKLYLTMIFVPFAISWLIVSLANSYAALLLGILIQGLGGGMSFCISTYISEIASREHRGALLSFVAVAYNFGVTICDMLMYNFKWNISSLIFLSFSLVFMACMSFLPESPIWLYNKGKKDEAIKILCSLRGLDKDKLESEIQDLEKFSNTKPTRANIKDMVKNIAGAWKQLLIVVALCTILQHTGYWIIVAYTIDFFDRLELPYDSAKMAVLFSICGFIGSIATPLFIHKLGRKTILSISSISMSLCMVVVGLYEELLDYESVKSNAWVVPAAFYLLALVVNIGVLPLGFIIGGEIFPNEIRGTMNGIYGIYVYLYWSFVVKVYPTLLFGFGIKIMIWSFVASCLIVTLFAVCILPETKGKTLNEVQQQYFQKKRKTIPEQKQNA